MSCVYFFLVAEASAISSALNTMSRGTFFSRASTSTSITSSRFPVFKVVAATNPSQFRNQPRALHVRERELDQMPFEFDAYRLVHRAAQHADEFPAARRVGSS